MNFFSRKPVLPPAAVTPMVESAVQLALDEWFNEAPELVPTIEPLVAALLPLPEVEWRPNARAKRLRLTIKAGRVWVTIPPRTSQTMVKKFLKDTDDWLRTQWQQQQTLKRKHEDQLALHPAQTATPQSGQSMTFPALQQTWQLDVSARYSRLTMHGDVLHVPEGKAVQALKLWVKKQADGYLPDRLARLAELHGFDYSGCTVRHARTRWGSCSRLGKINLNASLILLAPELLDYVLLHELCHTRQFNHSPLFWAEMHAVCPSYLGDRRTLKHIVLPAWWHA